LFETDDPADAVKLVVGFYEERAAQAHAPAAPRRADAQ
jgi:hypothetical protein